MDESGYQTKKGKSKRLNPNDHSRSLKKKISKENCINQIDELKERKKYVPDQIGADQIGFKEKRQECVNNMKNYNECDKFTEQLSHLKHNRHPSSERTYCIDKEEKK